MYYQYATGVLIDPKKEFILLDPRTCSPSKYTDNENQLSKLKRGDVVVQVTEHISTTGNYLLGTQFVLKGTERHFNGIADFLIENNEENPLKATKYWELEDEKEATSKAFWEFSLTIEKI